MCSLIFIRILQISEDSSRNQGITEILKELNHLRIEKDTLQQRLLSADVETKNLRENLHLMLAKSPNTDHLPSDLLIKQCIINLEMQLAAARSARDDALRQVDQLTEKFDAASKALYEVFVFRFTFFMMDFKTQS